MFTNTDVLMHYGIPNQVWGQRRFQYEDGTLTPAGRERYYKSIAKYRKNIENEKTKARISSSLDRAIVSNMVADKTVASAKKYMNAYLQTNELAQQEFNNFANEHKLAMFAGEQFFRKMVNDGVYNYMGTRVANYHANQYRKKSFKAGRLY